MPTPTNSCAEIAGIIADLKDGKMVIMIDDEDRENEGDLMIAAQKVRAADINFMLTHGRGLLCLTLTQERCEQLDLRLMVDHADQPHAASFTVSIDAATGIESGASANDRARTIRAAAARDARPEHLSRPGHVFPLMAQTGGVLDRAGHTEAGCDLARLAGLEPAAAITEVLNADGSMARRRDLKAFAKTHGIKIGSIADLIQYRLDSERISERSIIG
jgi:3,4-dihydroxy 2-butanone 4-phosphate synthase/GTP cyclohydrolase II